MTSWIAYRDVVSAHAGAMRVDRKTAEDQIAAGIVDGDLDVRDTRFLNTSLSDIPHLGTGSDLDDFREISRPSFMSWRKRLAIPTAPATTLDDGIYLSPFLQMMIGAVRHFAITETSLVKKAELKEYFLAQRLPDGSPISKIQASHLATFCRSAGAMRGGNKRVG